MYKVELQLVGGSSANCLALKALETLGMEARFTRCFEVGVLRAVAPG